jgi:membrane associated rhomboid family serine protease
MGTLDRRRSTARLLPPRPFTAAVLMLLFTGVLYLIEAYDLATGGALNQADCIVPRSPDRLDGVLFAPLLHQSWAHLDGNALYFLVFGFLAMAGGFGQFLVVTLIVWLVSGLGVWLISPPDSCTIGASGVIFGWLMFLLFRGFFARSGKQVLLAVVLLVLWGGVLLDLLPGQPQVSWQAHVFGALGGILAARMVTRTQRRKLAEGPVVPR